MDSIRITPEPGPKFAWPDYTKNRVDVPSFIMLVASDEDPRVVAMRHLMNMLNLSPRVVFE